MSTKHSHRGKITQQNEKPLTRSDRGSGGGGSQEKGERAKYYKGNQTVKSDTKWRGNSIRRVNGLGLSENA